MQGLYHSSGHDTLLFALFALTDAYDEWLRSPEANADVRRVLVERVVNPLRRHGLVGAKRIVALRLAICRATALTARDLVSENCSPPHSTYVSYNVQYICILVIK